MRKILNTKSEEKVLATEKVISEDMVRCNAVILCSCSELLLKKYFLITDASVMHDGIPDVAWLALSEVS